jgi:hypothetical protein
VYSLRYQKELARISHTVCIAVLLCYVQGYGNTSHASNATDVFLGTATDVFLGTGVYATTISALGYNTCAILSNNEYGKPISI